MVNLSSVKFLTLCTFEMRMGSGCISRMREGAKRVSLMHGAAKHICEMLGSYPNAFQKRLLGYGSERKVNSPSMPHTFLPFYSLVTHSLLKISHTIYFLSFTILLFQHSSK